MKKLLIAAVASAFIATPAFAQQTVVSAPNGNISVPLSGTLAKRCTVEAFLNGPFNALDLETTGAQTSAGGGAESLTVKCNYGGGATTTFTSANGGKLKDAANNEVPYTFYLSGSSLSGGVSLATPASWSGWSITSPTGMTRGMSVTLNQIATVAGTYTDTIQVAVQPN